jgi:hypothetical protein
MRKINLPFNSTVSMTFKVFDLSKIQSDGKEISIGSIDVAADCELLEIARVNAGIIIYATSSLESQIQAGISDYLFGTAINCSKQRNFFSRNFMESSFIEFSAKMMIYLRVLTELGFVKDKKESLDVEKLLRAVMNYRNSIAHGKLKVVDNIVHVEYYKGEPRCDKMDESYLSTLEDAFHEAYKAITGFNEKITNLNNAVIK